jgi:putative Holliday junction resolvase
MIKDDSMPEGNCLCFDFGLKRIGVAVGHPLIGAASEQSPLSAREGIPDWKNIEKLVLEWEPVAFVVGLPLNMDGTESELSRRATKFARRLHGRFNKPYFMMDERLSSYEAKGEAIQQDGIRDFGSHSVDGRAAALILESWFREKA